VRRVLLLFGALARQVNAQCIAAIGVSDGTLHCCGLLLLHVAFLAQCMVCCMQLMVCISVGLLPTSVCMISAAYRCARRHVALLRSGALARHVFSTVHGMLHATDGMP
jgi:hypothetical protein